MNCMEFIIYKPIETYESWSPNEENLNHNCPNGQLTGATMTFRPLGIYWGWTELFGERVYKFVMSPCIEIVLHDIIKV